MPDDAVPAEQVSAGCGGAETSLVETQRALLRLLNVVRLLLQVAHRGLWRRAPARLARVPLPNREKNVERQGGQRDEAQDAEDPPDAGGGVDPRADGEVPGAGQTFGELVEAGAEVKEGDVEPLEDGDGVLEDGEKIFCA